MAFTEIDLERQSQDLTLTKAKLKADFLAGADHNISGGNNNATWTGLSAGVNPNDAVNKAQLDAAVSGSMSYKGVIDAAAGEATLDGAITGDFYLVSVAGTLDGIAYGVGDHLVVNADITDFSVDGTGKIDLIDNTEAADILRDADIQNNLTTAVAGDVLDASQGKILKDAADLLQTEVNDTQTGAGLDTDGTYITVAGSNYIDGSTSLTSADILLDAAIKVNADAIAAVPTDAFSEEPTITVANPVLAALANTPVSAGTARVYINGLRGRVGAGNDYVINETTGVITIGFNPKAKDTIVVDYKY